MENEIDGLERMDDFDDEVEQLEEDEVIEKPKKKAKATSNNPEPKEPIERYAPFYQEQRIGIVDTITNEVIVEGMNDLNIAKLEAFKLNKLDKIGTVTGVD